MRTVQVTLLFVYLASFSFAYDAYEHVKTHHHEQRLHHHVRHRAANHQNRNKVQHREINVDGSTDPNGLELYYNEATSLLGFLNSTTRFAAVFNYSSNFFLILNGATGGGIAIDANSQIVFELNGVWTASHQNFELFFKSVSSIQTLVQSGHIVSNLTEIHDSTILHEINKAVSELGVETAESFVVASRILFSLHTTTLTALFKGEGHFRVRGGVTRVVTVLQGISDLFSQKPSRALSNSGVHLNLPDIINAPNGLQALLKILQSFNTQINWAEAAGEVFLNPEIFLKVIVELGGNDSSDRSIDNVFKLIYNIISAARGHGSLDALAQTLLEIGQDGGVEINGSDLTPIIDDLLKLADSQSSTYNNGGVFHGLIRFLRDLNENNLFMNDINISRLLLLLRRGDFRGAIDLVVRVFVHLNNVFNPTQSIPRFFGLLLNFFSSGRPRFNLSSIVPGSNISQLQDILHRINLTNLLQNRDGLSNISNIPIIGQIYHTISDSLSNASRGSLDFGNLFNSSGGLSEILSAFNRTDTGNIISNIFGGIFGGAGFVIPFNFLGGNNSSGGLNSLIAAFTPPSIPTLSEDTPSSATVENATATELTTPETDLWENRKKHSQRRHESKFHHSVKSKILGNIHEHLKNEKRYKHFQNKYKLHNTD